LGLLVRIRPTWPLASRSIAMIAANEPVIGCARRNIASTASVMQIGLMRYAHSTPCAAPPNRSAAATSMGTPSGYFGYVHPPPGAADFASAITHIQPTKLNGLFGSNPVDPDRAKNFPPTRYPF